LDKVGHYAGQRREQPAVFYLHPWELDPQQPRLAAGASGASPLSNLRDQSPLQRLLNDFEFGTLQSVLGTLAPPSAAWPRVSTPLPYVW
jgi:hypothetical protein